MRRIVLLAAILLATPALAQQRRQQPAPPPVAESVWGKGSADLQEAFNRDMARRGLTPRLDGIICDVSTTLACSAQLRGVGLRLGGQVTPEAVRDVRLVFTRSTPMPDVALLLHTLVAILEPQQTEDARRSAVLGLMGVGGPARDRVTVGRTEIRFADGFREMAFEFRTIPG